MKNILLILFLFSVSITTSAQYHNPETCSGVATCPVCYGTKGYYGMFGFTPCAYCGGRGVVKCGLCAAYKAGQQAAKEIQKNGTNSAPGGVYVAPSGSYSGSSSGSSGSSSRECSGCGGTGRCQACKYSDYPGKQKQGVK